MNALFHGKTEPARQLFASEQAIVSESAAFDDGQLFQSWLISGGKGEWSRFLGAIWRESDSLFFSLGDVIDDMEKESLFISSEGTWYRDFSLNW